MTSPSVNAKLGRRATHLVLGSRRWIRRHFAAAIAEMEPGRILEVGSGKAVGNEFPYSLLDLVPSGWEAVRSDIDAAYGHRLVDITHPPTNESFDAVVCSSVLEHVVDTRAAVAGIDQLLRPGGTAIVAVPAIYPLHDEPHDYWRFTEWALRELFGEFEQVEVHRRGLRRLPISLLVIACKSQT